MSQENLFLLHCSNNDDFGRYIRDTIVLDDHEAEQMLAKYRNCKHLFVVAEKAKHLDSFHSSDCETIPESVECVHCGLTNRLIKIEDKFSHHNHHIGEYYQHGIKVRTHSYVTEEFVNQFGWHSEGIDKQRFLSKEEFTSYHPDILYQIAYEFFYSVRNLLGISYSKTKEESIFLIMQELYEMETPIEQVKISSLVHASALIERFKNKHKL